MDHPHASFQLIGRASGGSSYGRTSARTSFDPFSTAGDVAHATRSPHAKDYGSAFSEGFLRYLQTGELADVVVEVVTDDHNPDDPPAASASGPAPLTLPGATVLPSLPSPASNRAATNPLQLSPSTTGRHPALLPPASASSPSPSDRLAGSATTAVLSEYRLHGLLLARHSAFFAAALGQEHFADSAARRIRLTLDAAAAPAWSTILEYFYCDRVRLDDSNALPLLALARQLLVPELDAYCTDYVCGRLCAANCLEHLRSAVRFALHDLHAECVALAAQGFPLLYGGDLGGLPPASVLEILTHPLLQVHCELQVVEAVIRYLSTTTVDSEAQRALCAQIRFPYLDNATITRLAVQPSSMGAAITGGRPTSDATETDIVADAAAAVVVAAAVGGGAADAEATSADPDRGTAALKVANSSSIASDAGPDAAAALPPLSAAANSAILTHGSAAVKTGQPAVEATGSGVGAPASLAADIITEGGDVEGGVVTAAAAAAGLNGEGHLSIAASAVDGAAEAAASAGGSDGSAAAAAIIAAAADGGGGADSGLLSASTSACSSPRSYSGGGAAEPPSPHPHVRSHHRPDSHHRDASADAGTDGGAAPAAKQNDSQPQPHHHHHALLPMLPRDMVLEGALARLAAMEYDNELLPPQTFSRSSLEHPHHPSPSLVTGAPVATGSGTGPTGHPVHHPYLHPYQPYQFQYQYGEGAAAGEAAAAAAANGRRRPLAVFQVQGAHQPQPPHLRPHQQHLAAPPPPPPAGGGPHAHALAHGLYYNHHVVPAGVPAPPSAQHLPVHLASSGSRGPAYGSGPGGGGGSRGEGEAGQQLVPGGGGAAAAGAGAAGTAAVFAAVCLPPPRLSYCCNLLHGLPGGCAWVDVSLDALWEHLVPYIAVQVSGCGEGSPRHVIGSEPDGFFETNDSPDPLPWVEVQLPHNVHVIQLHRYTFQHGHRRVGYYRARNFKTQIAVRPVSEVLGPAAAAAAAGSHGAGAAAAAGGVGAGAGAGAAESRPLGQPPMGPRTGGASPSVAAATPAACRYFDLTTRMAEQFDVGILSGATSIGPWRVLRIQATGSQEDGVHRLCVRGLRMYGIARVDLMQQSNDGFVVQPQWVINARLDQGGSTGGGAASRGSTGGGAGGAGYSLGGGGGAGGGGSGLQQWPGWHHGA